jgi:hypothetical protein
MLYRLSYGSNTRAGSPGPRRGALYATGGLATQASFLPVLTPVSRPVDSGGMTDRDRTTLSDKGKAEAEERQRRQAEALRANLARRKAQSRAREADPPPPEPKD